MIKTLQTLQTSYGTAPQSSLNSAFLCWDISSDDLNFNLNKDNIIVEIPLSVHTFFYLFENPANSQST